MTEYGYVVSIGWNNPSIEFVQILKETDKTYTLLKISYLYGRHISWYGERTLKSKITLFRKREDAINWLIDKIGDLITQLQEQQESMEAHLAELKALK